MENSLDKADESAVYGIKHDGWAEVVLNRPERRNAITGPLGEGLAREVNRFAEDDEVKAILLRGAQDAFCSGLDLDAFNAQPAPDWVADFRDLWLQAHVALYNCPKPVVGALQRYAINGGAALAIACDWLVVGEESFLQVGEIRIGMAAPFNLAWLTLRHSEAVTLRVALGGDRLYGAALKEAGLAQTCVAEDAVLAEATRICESLADSAGQGPQLIKTGVRAGREDAQVWFSKFTASAPQVKPQRQPA